MGRSNTWMCDSMTTMKKVVSAAPVLFRLDPHHFQQPTESEFVINSLLQMDLREISEMWMKEIAEVRKEAFPKVQELQKKVYERENDVFTDYVQKVSEIEKSRSSSEVRTERKSLGPLLETIKYEPFVPPKINSVDLIDEITTLYNYN
ncbi:hypothetical protein GE061_019764 [Apolygus lucorum]|uniref:Uncharacterized protein n=1 Tax=Apolygus lucorum TaxID=248454 RepID=A0A8S9XBB2_APOLU|nr:hypothetical protein GE061_019764 [Apolygus lucorum]